MFPDMPFGNMDSDKIEARKGLLETFLKVGGFAPSHSFSKARPPSDICRVFQQLCAMSEIANSEEMQEFLALNTDARIAFVKKPFIVSRIDKVSPLGGVFIPLSKWRGSCDKYTCVRSDRGERHRGHPEDGISSARRSEPHRG